MIGDKAPSFQEVIKIPDSTKISWKAKSHERREEEEVEHGSYKVTQVSKLPNQVLCVVIN